MTNRDHHPYRNITERKKTLQEAHEEAYIASLALIFLVVLVFGSWFVKWMCWL